MIVNELSKHNRWKELNTQKKQGFINAQYRNHKWGEQRPPPLWNTAPLSPVDGPASWEQGQEPTTGKPGDPEC